MIPMTDEPRTPARPPNKAWLREALGSRVRIEWPDAEFVVEVREATEGPEGDDGE